MEQKPCKKTVKGKGKELARQLSKILEPEYRHDFRIFGDDEDEDTYTVEWEQARYPDDEDCN